MKARIKFFLSGQQSAVEPYWWVYARSSQGKHIDTTGSLDSMVRDLAKDYVPSGKSGTIKLEFEKTSLVKKPENSFTVASEYKSHYRSLKDYVIEHNENGTKANVCKEWFHKIFGETKIGDVWTLTKVTWEPEV